MIVYTDGIWFRRKDIFKCSWLKYQLENNLTTALKISKSQLQVSNSIFRNLSFGYTSHKDAKTSMYTILFILYGIIYNTKPWKITYLCNNGKLGEWTVEYPNDKLYDNHKNNEVGQNVLIWNPVRNNPSLTR